jgi:hypothetical protein
MTNLAIDLNKPTVRATEAQVRSIDAPEGTATWNPIRHSRLLDSVDRVIEAENLSVIRKEYTLASYGRQLFGTLIIENGDKKNVMLGFRNANDQSFAVGLCGGVCIIVCANMMFSGDFETFHKHTSGLNDALMDEMAASAYLSVSAKQKDLEAWHSNLLQFPIRETELEAMSFRAMKQGIVPPHRFKDYLECLGEEVKIADEMSLHTFHAGVTRLIRNDNLFKVAQQTPMLAAFCDVEAHNLSMVA